MAAARARPYGRGMMAIRTAAGEDRGAIAAMLVRCSPGSLWARFHGGNHAPAGLLHGDVMVATVGPDVIAVGNLVEAELAVLVEDGWQRLGVGSAVLAALLGRAAMTGVTVAAADVQLDNRAAIALCRGAGGHARPGESGLRFTFTLP